MTKSKTKEPISAKQLHMQANFKAAHNRFLSDMDNPHGTTDWQFDAASRKYYIDNNNLYDCDEGRRKFVLVEIHEGSNTGFNFLPNMGYILFFKGKRIASDESLARLKDMANEMIKPPKKKKK